MQNYFQFLHYLFLYFLPNTSVKFVYLYHLFHFYSLITFL